MNASIFLFSELILHIGTAVIVGSYYDPKARFKWAPTILAASLMTMSGLLIWRLLFNWSDLLQDPPQPELISLFLLVFLLVAWCRGDTALLIRRVRAYSKLTHWPWK